MGFIIVAMACWLTAIAATRLSGGPHPVGAQPIADQSGSTAEIPALYWWALNNNTY